MPSRRILMRRPPAGLYIAACLPIGAGVTAAVWPYVAPAVALLAGWDGGAVIYLVGVWVAVARMNPDVTARMAGRENPSNPVAELLVVAASIAALVAVGFALVRAGQSKDGTKALFIAIGTISVVVSWLIVHTIYMLRYARSYYSEPTGGIEFNEPDRPAYLDFAYFSFTIGMTFQVSDTNITAKGIRRLALYHALLSYLFGAVILATAINVFASLLH